MTSNLIYDLKITTQTIRRYLICEYWEFFNVSLFRFVDLSG